MWVKSLSFTSEQENIGHRARISLQCCSISRVGGSGKILAPLESLSREEEATSVLSQSVDVDGRVISHLLVVQKSGNFIFRDAWKTKTNHSTNIIHDRQTDRQQFTAMTQVSQCYPTTPPPPPPS